MVSINYAFKEIISKIVYYGPGLSGKTTNLQYVFKKVPSETRGELISLATDADRTLYFDFLPVNVGTIQGFSTKFQLYTVPGQVYYNATRKLVLRGVDGLVFVADSQVEKMDENVESLQNLKDNLEEYGYDIDQIPMVVQYNKRDLPNIADIAQLEQVLNPRGLPCFEAVAVTGEGVFKTLKAISKMVLDQVRAKRMEPARIAVPEPVEVAAGLAPRATAEAASFVHIPQTDQVMIPPNVELAPPPVPGDDKIGTKRVEAAIIAESDTRTTVVVSDTHEDKKAHKEETPSQESLEETTEKAVLDGEPSEPETKTEPELVKPVDGRYVIEDQPYRDLTEPRYGAPMTGGSFNQESTQIADFDLKSPMPLGKPQMAESRKVKGKGALGLFGIFRKKKK
jgi:signal recognition particle receptor subunit beta